MSITAFAPGLHAQPVQDQPTAGPSQQQSPIPGPVGNSPAPSGPAPGDPGFATQLFASSRSSLLGDLYGVRSYLRRYGISLGLQETGEVFGNATGGTRQGAAYNGLTTMSLGMDTEPAFGWQGGVFNVSAFQIHGRNLSAENLQTLNTASGIEANRSTRLWELWYQQSFLDRRVDVKIGQQSLDQEFMGSQGASTFINTAMGWPALPSYDLYAGGPAYPLASPGVRVRGQLTKSVTALLGVFDDNPPGGPFFDDSQVRGAAQSGTKFNTGTGALVIGELQFSVNQPSEGQVVTIGNGSGLPGLYKLGGWYDSGTFFDQRTDTAGLPLGDPNSNGQPRTRRHNYSIYATADQVVWPPGPDEPRSISVFARVMGAPGDRNLVDLGVNAGIVMRAPFEGRDNDSVGLGYGLAKIGSSAARFVQNVVVLGPNTLPQRSSESFIELTYQYQVAPWWSVQPDFQYVFLPSGGIPNSASPGKRIGNEAVFGARTNVTF